LPLLSRRARASDRMLIFVAVLLATQNGDHAGEAQPENWRAWEISAAPARSAAEEAASFRVPAGYRVELIACEPLVHDPVAFSCDERGRVFVVEMRGFMPNADGRGELEPIGAIARLEDRDGDGCMDTRCDFLLELVLPRAVCALAGGALVLAPPDLLWCPDADDDGIADRAEVVATGFAGRDNPEHAPNGLLWGLDNWIHLANCERSFRMRNGIWEERRVASGGQWGLTEDDWGRRYFNYNSSPLHADLVPAHYLVRNPDFGKAPGGSVSVGRDGATWPSRITAGVNRGYQPATLRTDGRLRSFTAVCGPAVFRGTALAPADLGTVFLCEPSGNFVRQERFEPDSDGMRSRNARGEEEFWTSTDERFRPVNAATGPDGALWVADLYRGLIQHRIFLTSYLRKQVEERGLEQPTGLGRLWRVAHESADLRAAAPTGLAEAGPAEWAAWLEHPNAFWRVTGQRLLVERGAAPEIIAQLEKLALEAEDPRARVHALGALDGLVQTKAAVLAVAAKDPHPKVRAFALRCVESLADADSAANLWKEALADHDPAVRRQAVLSLGESPLPSVSNLLALELLREGDDELMRGLILSGARHRTVELAVALHASQASAEPGCFKPVMRDLGRCAGRSAELSEMRSLLSLSLMSMESEPDAVAAMMIGMREGLMQSKRGSWAVPRPASLAQLMECERLEIAQAARALDAVCTWASVEAILGEDGLPEEARARIAAGRIVYETGCIACHKSDGGGLAGLAPPLAGSEWLDRDDDTLAGVVLFGLEGPIQVKGEEWNLAMPGHAALLSDAQVAEVISFVRWEYSGRVSAPDHAAVAARRASGKPKAD